MYGRRGSAIGTSIITSTESTGVGEAVNVSVAVEGAVESETPLTWLLRSLPTVCVAGVGL